MKTYSSNIYLNETDKVMLSARAGGFDIRWGRILHGKLHVLTEIWDNTR
jgi:hypothetical protein